MWMNSSLLPHTLPGHWWPLQCDHSPGPAGCWGHPLTGSAAARAIGGPAPGCPRRWRIGVRPGPGGRCCCRCWPGGAASRAGRCPTLVRNCGSWSPGSFCRPRTLSWRIARMGSMIPFQIGSDSINDPIPANRINDPIRVGQRPAREAAPPGQHWQQHLPPGPGPSLLGHPGAGPPIPRAAA